MRTMLYRHKKYRKISVCTICYLGILFLIQNTTFPSWQQWSTIKYFLVPCLWSGVLLVIKYRLPVLHNVNKSKYYANVKVWAFNCGVAWVILSLLTGVIEGFGRSPYDHSLKGIVMNTLTVGLPLVGGEYLRHYLLTTFNPKQLKVAIVSVTLLMILGTVDWLRIIDLQTFEDYTIFIAQHVLPAIGHNVLASYLSLYGGVSSSLIYLGIVEAFEWLPPILANMSWLLQGVIGFAVPIVCLSIVTQSYLKLTKVVKPYKEKEEPIWQWLPVTVAMIGIVWFTVGVFPVYPSVIVTGSMEPMIYAGDVVLIEKMQSMADLHTLKVGDVIAFEQNNIIINHRIQAVIDEEETGLKVYQTKGDNNSAVDRELVKMEDVKGIIRGVVPKIGWPTLILKSRDTKIMEQVEF